MALYDGLDMTGGALPKRASGFLGLLGVSSNPLLDFLHQHSNALTGFGAGLAGGGPDIGQAIGSALQMGGQGKTADYTRSEKVKADATLAQQKNYTIEAFKKANRPDLVEMANAGMMDQAWSKFMKDPIAVGKDTTLVDLTTFKPVFSNAGTDNAGGPFEGTGMDAQVGNILLTGDPNTADYAYAYSIASQPKITMQRTPNGLVPVYQTPDLSSVRPPTYRGAAPGGAAATQSPAPTSPGPMVTGTDNGLSPAISAPSGINVGTALPGTLPAKTEAQQRMDLLGGQLVQDLPTVIKNYDVLSSPAQKALGSSALTSWANSPEYKQANNALRASIGNIVYAVSGANSTPQEQQRKISEVMPAINDDPQTLLQKKQRLAVYVNQIAAASNDPDLKKQAAAMLQQLNAPAQQPAAPVTDMGNGVTIQEIP